MPIDLKGVVWTEESVPFSNKLAYCHNIDIDSKGFIRPRGGMIKWVAFDRIEGSGGELERIYITDIWELNGDIYVGAVLPRFVEDNTGYYRKNVGVWKVEAVWEGDPPQLVFRLVKVLNNYLVNSNGIINRIHTDSVQFWKTIKSPKGYIIYTGGSDFYLQTYDGDFYKIINRQPPILGNVILDGGWVMGGTLHPGYYPSEENGFVQGARGDVKFVQSNGDRRLFFTIQYGKCDSSCWGRHRYSSEACSESEAIRTRKITDVTEDFGFPIGVKVVRNNPGSYYPDFRYTIENKASESPMSDIIGTTTLTSGSECHVVLDPRFAFGFKRSIKVPGDAEQAFFEYEDILNNYDSMPLGVSDLLSEDVWHSYDPDFPRGSTPTQQKQTCLQVEGENTILKIILADRKRQIKVGQQLEIWYPGKVVENNRVIFRWQRLADSNGSYVWTVDSVEQTAEFAYTITFSGQVPQTDFIGDNTNWAINEDGDVKVVIDIENRYEVIGPQAHHIPGPSWASPDIGVEVWAGFNVDVVGFQDGVWNNCILGKGPIFTQLCWDSGNEVYRSYYALFPQSLRAFTRFREHTTLWTYGPLTFVGPLIIYETIPFSGNMKAFGHRWDNDEWVELTLNGDAFECILADYALSVHSYLFSEEKYGEVAQSLKRRIKLVDSEGSPLDSVIDMVLFTKEMSEEDKGFFKYLAEYDARKINLYRRDEDGNYREVDSIDISWDYSSWDGDDVSFADFPPIIFTNAHKTIGSLNTVGNVDVTSVPGFDGALHWNNRLIVWRKNEIWWSDVDGFSFSPLRCTTVPNRKNITDMGVIGEIEYVTGKNAPMVILQEDAVWLFAIEDDIPAFHYLGDIGGFLGQSVNGKYYFIGNKGLFVVEGREVLPMKEPISHKCWESFVSKYVSWDTSRFLKVENSIILSLSLNTWPFNEDFSGGLPAKVPLTQKKYGYGLRNIELIWDITDGLIRTRSWAVPYLNQGAVETVINVGADCLLPYKGDLIGVVNMVVDESSGQSVNKGFIFRHSSRYPVKDCLEYDGEHPGIINPETGYPFASYIETHDINWREASFSSEKDSINISNIITVCEPKAKPLPVYVWEEGRWRNIIREDMQIEQRDINWQEVRLAREFGVNGLPDHQTLLSGLRKYGVFYLPISSSVPYIKLKIDLSGVEHKVYGIGLLIGRL